MTGAVGLDGGARHSFRLQSAATCHSVSAHTRKSFHFSAGNQRVTRTALRRFGTVVRGGCWWVAEGRGGGGGIALTLASISWDCAPLNHFSASGRTVSSTRPRLWPISFSVRRTEPKFVLKVLQEFPVFTAEEGIFLTPLKEKSFIKTADEGRTLPTSSGEASFMNKMLHRGGFAPRIHVSADQWQRCD